MKRVLLRVSRASRWWRLALLGAAPLAWGQPVPPPPAVMAGTPFLRVYDRDETAGSPVTWQVAVHPNGFVYAGNNLRLLEFDGVAWRGRKFARTLSPDTLVIDGRGRIWASIGEAVDCFTPDADGRLVQAPRQERLPEAERKFGAFRRAVARPEGVYFMGEQHLVLFRTDEGVRVWRATTAFESLWTMGGALYLAQKGRGFARLEPDGTLREFAVAGAVPPIWRGIASAVPGAPAVLLTARGPLTWAGPAQPLVPVSAGATALFAEAPAVAAVVLSDGRWAFGTEKRGLIVLSAAGEVQQRVDESHGLLSSRVNGLAEDAEGGLWLAQHNGIARVQVGQPFERLTGERGYRGSVRAVVRHAGRLYLGHADGVSVQDAVTGQARLLADIPANTNGAICFLPLGERLLTSVSGIREITPDGRLKLVAPVAANTLAAARRHAGAFFAGTPGRGLWLLTPTPEGGWRAEGPVAQVPPRLVRLLDTDDGYLWGTTSNGTVWRADFRAGLRLDAPVDLFGPERGAPATVGSDFRQIYALGGTVGVVNSTDILRFDAAAQRFVPETRIADLPMERKPEAAEPAGADTLWMHSASSSSAGLPARLLRVRPAGTDRWRAEPWPAGPLNWVTVNSLYADPVLPKVWLATQIGVLSADTTWTPGSRGRAPWSAWIREVTTPQNRTVFSGAWSGGAARTWTRQEAAVRFNYAAPTYAVDHAGRGHTLYRTRLDGLDDAWSPWTAETFATYTNLPGGRFVFHVQARDILGHESREATLAFALPPPWWLSAWAWLGYVSLLGTGFLGALRLRTRTLRRKNEQLEKIVATRTEDLRRQNGELARLHQLELDEKISARLGEEKAQLDVLRYQLNPHFLFNSLTSIRSQIPPTLGSARDTLDRLADFCRLTLTGRKAEERTTIGEEISMLRAYLDIEQTRLGELLSVAFDVDATLDTVTIPRLLLLPLVENALKYGQATSEDTFGLKISVQRPPDGGEGVVFEIANTGTWVERGSRPGIPSTGIGHENLRERLRRHYPDAFGFSHVAANGWVHVRLELRAAPAG